MGTAVKRRPREAVIANAAAACSRAGSSSSRSDIVVREAGAPGRVGERIASRLCVSGRRRTTATWSAPVPIPSSSTMASTIASGDTERDRPRRIRANDSASVRRAPSPSTTLPRSRAAASVTTPMRMSTTRSRLRGSRAKRTVSTAPRTRSDSRRGRRVRARAFARSPPSTMELRRNLTLAQGWGRTTPRASRPAGTVGGRVPVLPYCLSALRTPPQRPRATRRPPVRGGRGRWVGRASSRARLSPRRRRRPEACRACGPGAAPVLGVVQPEIRDGDQLGRGPPVRGVGRDADRGADRERHAPLGGERRVAERLEDASGHEGRARRDRSRAESRRTRRRRSAPRRPRSRTSRGSAPHVDEHPVPKRCPNESLTSLKSSRSSIRTLSGRRVRAARTTSSARRSCR